MGKKRSVSNVSLGPEEKAAEAGGPAPVKVAPVAKKAAVVTKKRGLKRL